MAFRSIISHRLVKGKDLNHHKSLFAGRCAEWIVESSYVAIATKLEAEHVVCMKIHGIEFLQAIYSGDVLILDSKIVCNGRTTLTVYTRVYKAGTPEDTFCDGFITFLHVDANTSPKAHGIDVIPSDDEEWQLHDIAKELSLTCGRRSS